MAYYDCTDLYGYGRMQRRILCSAQLSGAVTVFHVFAMSILAPRVDHWCKQPEYADFYNLTATEWKNMNIPYSEGTYSRCEVYDPPVATVNLTINRTIVSCNAWDYDHMEDAQTIISEWNLVCSRDWLIQVAKALYFTGSVVTIPVVGHMIDKVGRRPILYASTFSTLASAIAVTFAMTFGIFVAARVCLGASLSTLKMANFVLLFEVTPLDHRNSYCCLVHCGTLASILVMDIIHEFFVDRNVAFMILLWPTSFLIYNFYVVEESPQWLFAANNLRGAERTIRTACYYNDFPFDVRKVRMELTKQKEESCKKAQAEVSPVTFINLITCETTRQRTLAICYTWLSAEFVLYGVGLYTVSGNTLSFNLSSTALLFVALLLLVRLLRSHGRKRILTASLTAAIASCSCLCITKGTSVILVNQALYAVTITLMFVATVVIYIYCAELYPAACRGIGFSCCYFCGKVGSACAVTFNILAQRANPRIPFAASVVLMLGAWFLLQDLPDTGPVNDRDGENDHATKRDSS